MECYSSWLPIVAGLVRQVDRSIPTRSVLAKDSIEELLEGTPS